MTGLNAYDTYGKTVYYNDVPTYNDCPDRPWQVDYGYSTLDNIMFPFIYVNPGIRKVPLAETVGIKKYKFNGGTDYVPVEETHYTYKLFDAPYDSQKGCCPCM